MKIRIKTKDLNLSLTIPVSAAKIVTKKIPESIFDNMQEHVPEPYNALLSREMLTLLIKECSGTLRTIRNMEIIHIETPDETYISIRM